MTYFFNKYKYYLICLLLVLGIFVIFTFSINKDTSKNSNNKSYSDSNNNSDNKINENINDKKETLRDEEFFKDKKLLAFTFDDGPNYETTQYLLEELDKRDAKVSFFMVGERVIKQPELVKEIYEKGHTIGSHSYSHKNLLKLNDDELKKEISYTNEIIKKITNEDVKYLRPPYGSYNNDILNKIDMTFILWNVDTLDWQKKDSQKIANYIIENVKDGDIILLHDLYKTSIDGLLKALDELKKEGYAFVSIDEMIKLKNIDIKTHTAYRYLKK